MNFSNTRARRSTTLAAALAAVVLLAGCSTTRPAETQATAVQDQGLVAELGFGGMDAKAIIEQLDSTPLAGRNADLMASIRPGEIVLADASKREASVPMPSGEFYVSVAPYVEQTHSCHFHSLTTCVGELANRDVEVTVVDSKSGKILIEGGRKTYDNGFVGLWLPRGIDATLTISSGGKRATAEVSTKDADDATCLTTLQLL